MKTAGQKQVMAMTAGGIFGITCLIGMVLLLRRRILDPRIRATSQFSDLPILIILFVQLATATKSPNGYNSYVVRAR